MIQYDFLMIGGGVSSVSACKAIRETDTQSSIAILTDEITYPVDRPPLSKRFLIDDSWSAANAETAERAFYKDHNIDLLTDQRATRLDPINKRVSSFDGKIYQFGKLLLATGSRAQTIVVPGIRLEGIHTLRTANDAVQIRDSLLRSETVAIIGGGFLAIEVAAAALKRGVRPTLVVRGPRLLAGLGSDEFASYVAQHLVEMGATIIFDDEAVFFAGSKTLKSIHTRNGQELSTGMALIAVGSAPNTEWLQSSDLRLAADGGVIVDHQLRTAVPGIWAAGDIASLNGQRIEHHLNAKWQGLHAGATMANHGALYDRVSYIYSDIGDLHINIRGKVDSGQPALSLTGKEHDLNIHIYTDDIGAVKGVLAWSASDPQLDRVTEASELLIRRNMPVDGLCAEDFTDY